METYFGGEELRFEFRVITVRQSSSNLHVRKLKWHGCMNKCVFISVLHLLTLSGRFRVGFGRDPRYLNSEPPQYVSVVM